VQKLRKYIDAKGLSHPNLYRDEVTGIFYVRTRDLGKISLETTVPKVAIPKIYTATEELRRRKEKAHVAEGQNLLMRDLYAKLVEIKKTAGIQESTLARLDSIWKLSLEPFWGNIPPNQINQERVDAFMEWHRRNRKDVQFVNVFKYLGNLFNLALDYGYLTRTSLPKLKLPRPEEKHHAAKKGRVVDHDEFEAVRKHLKYPYSLIATIAYYMGMRKMEIGKLSVDQIMIEKGKVFIDLSERDTKTGIPRIISVPKFIADDLIKAREKAGRFLFEKPSDPKTHVLPSSIDRAWRVAKGDAEIKDRIRFHDLRGTVATNMARAGVNPILAVTYLGMTLATYQRRYLKLTKEDLLIISDTAGTLFKKAEVSK
jgi:integrase